MLLSKKNRMGKSQRAKPPRDGDDAARATSTRAEDAFELLADTVAAAAIGGTHVRCRTTVQYLARAAPAELVDHWP